MKVDITFVGQLKKSGMFTVEEIPYGNSVYEYSIANYTEGSVICNIYLEDEIIDINNNTIGHFGIDFINKYFVYNLREKVKK